MRFYKLLFMDVHLIVNTCINKMSIHCRNYNFMMYIYCGPFHGDYYVNKTLPDTDKKYHFMSSAVLGTNIPHVLISKIKKLKLMYLCSYYSVNKDKDSLIGSQEFVVGYSKAPSSPQSSTRPICRLPWRSA